MKIEIWSDIACPYCYIGKRKLEKALGQFSHSNEIELLWHSYELNPDLPKSRIEEDYYYTYFADHLDLTVEKAKEILTGIQNLAREVGLEYNYDKLIAANTSDALRLIKLANKQNLATEAEEVLFKAYFTDGEDISNHATLVRLGVSIGLSEKEVHDMLKGTEYLDDIEKDIRRGEDELNLEYIPFYLFNNKDVIQGSIATDDYLKILENSYADWKKNGVSDSQGDFISGQACSIDGKCS